MLATEIDHSTILVKGDATDMDGKTGRLIDACFKTDPFLTVEPAKKYEVSGKKSIVATKNAF